MEEKNILFNYITRIILGIFGIFGIIEVFNTSMEMKLNMQSVFVYAAIFMSAYVVCMYVSHKWKFAALIPLGSIILYVIINFSKLSMGAPIFYNDILTSISRKSGWNFEKLLINQAEYSVQNSEKEFLFLVVLIMSYIIAVEITSIGGLVGALLVEFPVFVFFIVFNCIPGTKAFIYALVFIFAAAVLAQEAHAVPMSIMAVLTLITAILVLCIIPEKSFVRNGFFKKANAIVGSQFTELLNDNNVQDDSDIAMGGINRGKLGNLSKIVYKQKTIFSYTTADIGKNQYISMFIGNMYNANQWYSYTAPYKDTITDALVNAIDKDEQYQTMLMGSSKNYYDKVFRYNTQIRDLDENAKKEMKSNADTDDYGGFLNKVKTNIIVDNYNDFSKFIQNADTLQLDTENCDFKSNSSYFGYFYYHQQYKKDLTKKNCHVPSEVKETINKLIGERVCTTTDEKLEYVQFIKKYLEENYKYSMAPGRVPEDEDFVQYFLTQKKEGYCTYFASAATLMFRCAGIPARYVEGYIVTKSQIRDGEKELGIIDRYDGKGNLKQFYYDQYTVDVKDSSAHAWVEIYIDGYGWMTVEVTPGNNDEEEDMTGWNIFKESHMLENQESVFESTQASEESKKEDISEDSENVTENTETYFQSHSEIADSGDESFGNSNRKCVVFSITAVVILLCMGYTILYCRYKNWKSHYKSLKKNKDILRIYAEFERMLEYLKIGRMENVDYKAYAEYLNEVSDICNKYDIKKVLDVVLKYRFSEGSYDINSDMDNLSIKVDDSDDRSVAIEIIQNIRNDYLNQQKWIKKVWMKYICLF